MRRSPTGIISPRVADAAAQQAFTQIINRLNQLEREAEGVARMVAQQVAADTGTGTGIGPDAPGPDETQPGLPGIKPLDVPPVPLRFEAFDGYGFVMLSWENPFLQYRNHAHTEVWRAQTVDQLSEATKVGTVGFALYVDDDVDLNVDYYYWIRYVSTTDVIGDWSQSATARGHLVSPDDLNTLTEEEIEKLQEKFDLLRVNKDQLPDINANEIVGLQAFFESLTVLDAQIRSLAANKLTGLQATFDNLTVRDAQIGSLAAAKLVGLQAVFDTLTVNGANIETATIITAAFAKLSVTEAVLANGAATNLKIGNIIKSNNYDGEENPSSSAAAQVGTKGWLINKNGKMVMDLAYVRGTLAAAHIDSDVPNSTVLFEGSTPLPEDTNVSVSLVSGADVRDWGTLIFSIRLPYSSANQYYTVGSCRVSGMPTAQSNTYGFICAQHENISGEDYSPRFRLWRNSDGSSITLRESGQWRSGLSMVLESVVAIKHPDGSPPFTPVDPPDPTPATTVVANAGSNQTVQVGTTVNLAGSANVQNGVGDTSYGWARVSGSAVSLRNANTRTPSFTAPSSAGSVTLRLTARNNGVSDTDDITITFQAAPPPITPATTVVADAGSNQTVQVGTTVNLAGSANVQNGVGDTSYGWARVSGSAVSLRNANTRTPSFTAPSSAGSVTLRLTARNNGVSDTDDVVITFEALTPATTTVVANAGANITRRSAASFSRAATAQVTNPSGTTIWRWRRLEGAAAAVSFNPTSPTVNITPGSEVTSGSTVFEVRATNNGVSDTDTFTVTWDIPEPEPELPNADAPTLNVSGWGGGVTRLPNNQTYTASIGGGTYDSISYQWSVSRGSFSGQGTSQINVRFSSEGSFSVTCTVTVRGTGTNAKEGTSDSVSDNVYGSITSR